VSEPNKQLSYLQKTTFLFGTRPKQSHPNKEKRGVAVGRERNKRAAQISTKERENKTPIYIEALDQHTIKKIQ